MSTLHNLRGRRICLVGSTSRIARAVARELVARGAILHLGARDLEEARRDAVDLEVRSGLPVSVGRFQALDLASHAAFLAEARQRMGGLDCVVVAFGILGDQERARRDFSYARQVMDLNFLAPASVLSHAAAMLEDQGTGGMLVALGSVAGDRGRLSNYTYGSAKAGLHAYLQGLRARLASAGIRVLTVKPGPVDTPMTFGMGFPGGRLTAQPEAVARGIVRAMERGSEVVYVPCFWNLIMGVLKAIPESIFKRMKL